MEHIEVARSISDLGMMAVTAAFFLLFSAATLTVFVRFFVKLINNIVHEQKTALSDLLEATRMQNACLADISEGLRDENLSRTKILSSQTFELNNNEVQRMIRKIREENHIEDRVATGSKIRRLLRVQHDNRNSRLDNFKFRGKRLSRYTDEGWIEKIAQVVEGEIYHDAGVNNDRAYTNVTACFDDIKLEFYHNLMSR